MPTQTTLSRVESFPFDSRFDGYDEEGYPVYDRAVGASMLRETFEKFFSDGVFPSPGDALQISKGSGLTVTIKPGVFIIRGAMGGYLTDAHSLTLDTAAPQGNVCYGVMLRYDENEQHRSCYLRVVRGDAASSPQPPAPDQSTPGVMEYRLGYVTVPTGATDLSSATVTNEKGLDVCPYAAPFEDIDLSKVVHDAQVQASESLNTFMAFLQKNWDLVNSAIDGTTAGNLQSQINELENNALTTENIDNSTIVFEPTTTSGGANRLQVNDLSIGTGHLKDKSVTQAKLGDDVATVPVGAENQEILSHVGGVTGWTKVSGLLDSEPVELWSGDWRTGSITVEEIKHYSVYEIEMYANHSSTPRTKVIAVRLGDEVSGAAQGNMYSNSTGTNHEQAIFVVGFTISSGGVLTGNSTDRANDSLHYCASGIYDARLVVNPYISSIKGVC